MNNIQLSSFSDSFASGSSAPAIKSNCFHGFEGPEKRLEIDFKKNPNRPLGLREMSSDDNAKWQEMLDFAKCTIISTTKNEHFDSYVLSESSLFVYPYKVMIKTCGTTTLLRVIPKLMQYAASLDLTVEFVMFSRKNFLFPQQQVFPHRTWEEEVSYLNKFFDGQDFLFGHVHGDHWYLYLADYSQHEPRIAASEKTIEIMMHKMDPSSAERFFKKDSVGERDKFPGVADLIPGSTTDEFNFSPCGYSMNGLKDETYWTIHVTPESHCSYASFETNLSLASYSKLVSNVADFFVPEIFTVALFIERPQAVKQVLDDEEVRKIYTSLLDIPGYQAVSKNISDMEHVNSVLLMLQYRSDASLAYEATLRAETAMKEEEDVVAQLEESLQGYLSQYKRKAVKPPLMCSKQLMVNSSFPPKSASKEQLLMGE
jgi:S-adenosylmethionine decarboxylase